MSDQVYMDTPAVLSASKELEMIAETLENSSSSIEVLMSVLKATSARGATGTGAVAYFEETIKPKLAAISTRYCEMGNALREANKAYGRGDNMGGTRFF